MMELVRQWIVSITCAAVLLAAVRCLMPPGGARQVGCLAGGLVLLLCVASPLVHLDVEKLALTINEYSFSGQENSDLLNTENERLIKQIIEGETAAYITDKARELGAQCRAEVTFSYSDDGAVDPVAVTVRGTLTQWQQEQLSSFIASELAVPKENQTFEGMVEP